MGSPKLGRRSGHWDIHHNERKVTCKHPVTGQPSQDNCIFVVNDQASSTMTSQETKDRTLSVTSDNSNCIPDSAANPTSDLTRSSRPPGKLHNFGKRSNSIKRNPNAPVMMRGWLYKKANSGMKMWKKRWFVLSDLCLFYYRDEKEEGVLGSILLPSFQISAVSPDDHINRTHAFKSSRDLNVSFHHCRSYQAAHPNMRTYYFCTDTSKEMELWMRVMIGASLVHSEPIKRTNVTKVEDSAPQESNHIGNHRLLIRPENNNTLRNKDIISKVGEKAAREAEKYGFQKDGLERPLTKINSVKHQSYIYDYDEQSAHYRSVHANGPDNRIHESQHHTSETDSRVNLRSFTPHEDAERVIQRTNSMLQLEQWIRAQREKGPEDESSVVMSYQTLPRNMPSYRAQIVPRYPEGYKTLPRNLKTRPESVCSTTGMISIPGTTEEKRRSVRDDTMWQLYEWQQRQFYNKQTTLRRHSSLTSPKTMVHISEQTLHSIPLSPSHGSISGYHTYSPHRAYRSELSSPVQRGDLTIDRRQKAPASKLGFPDRRSAPVVLTAQPLTQKGLQGKTPEELTLLLIKLRRQQAELSSIREHTLTQLLHLKQSCSQKNETLSHHLQRNLLYVDDQMKDNDPLISMVHTMIENSALRPHLFQQMSQEDCRPTAYKHRTEEVDVDAKLSSLCEQDKLVQAMEEKLQQLHKEKYTVEQALLSASQEIEMNANNPEAIQSVVLQRDELQNGLLSTCREVSRATTELERSWREYDKLERDVTTARNKMREHLERLGEVQTESAGIQRAQMQKEIWRIQDVMEGLSNHKQQRAFTETGKSDTNLFSSAKNMSEDEELAPPRPPLPRSYDFSEPAPPLPNLPSDSSSSLLCYSKGPVHLPDDKSAHHVQGPDYRLYKSEPELTTVAEVDESNGDDKTELTMDKEAASHKGSHFPVGIVPPRTKSPPLESTTIASYVTLRKNKKLENKSERPRSAVEHLCIAESPRPRMSLSEQLERMRRHQAACLKEKKKGFSIPVFADHSPAQSPSLSREDSVQLTQLRKKEENVISNSKDIENPVQGSEAETPSAEIITLKDMVGVEESRIVSDKEPGDTDAFENYPAPVAKDVGTEDRDPQSSETDHVPEPHGNCLQVVSSVPKRKSENGHNDENMREVERSGILFSYDFSADTLRRQTALEAGNRPPLQEPPTLPAPAAQTQLTEGSHFMCV